MKTRLKNVLSLPVLACLSLMPADWAAAQTFNLLHTFAPTSGFINGNLATNVEGGLPVCTLVLSSNILYGTAEFDGTSGNGTIFALNTDGLGFTNLHEFTAMTNFTNNDGADPYAGLLLSGNLLYGAASQGGQGGSGSIFVVNTSGSGFTNLYSLSAYSIDFSAGKLTNVDGIGPSGTLVLSGGILYGTTESGSSNENGTVFAINANGTGYTNLHVFAASTSSSSINSDGLSPVGGLLLSGNTLYGTTAEGGSNGDGTVFAIKTSGMGFTNLHIFSNKDGAFPESALVLSGNTLYGTTADGGPAGRGTVFAVNIDGTGFTNLYVSPALVGGKNTFGAAPYDKPVLSGNTLYVTGSQGGTNADGSVFALDTNGSNIVNLYNFTGPDGADPYGGMILSNQTLYGTTRGSPQTGNGTVFSILLTTQVDLDIARSGTNVILTWPASASGFALQSTTNLTSATIWTSNSTPPVVINGTNTVTNAISGARMFYRLSN